MAAEGRPVSPTSSAAPRRWKGLLALLSLVICGLLWFSGLQQSLQRPSVNGILSIRQLELSAQVAPLLPAYLRQGLAEEQQPLEQLRKSLNERIEQPDATPRPAEKLELALLDARAGDRLTANRRLADLEQLVTPAQLPLLTSLAREQSPTSGEAPTSGIYQSSGEASQSEQAIKALLEPWSLAPLTHQLACEQLGGAASLCKNPAADRLALLRWLTVSGLPVLLLLAGLGLLGREGWRLWRRRGGPLAALVAPALALEDVTLLIAGGFVVLGELVAPLLLVPIVQALLMPLAGRPALQQGLQVLLLYMGVMVAPLTILALQLRPLVPAPQGGWLQWRWRPGGSALGLGLAHVLMVLPLVALAGWLIERLWSQPSGSNPLLELVLTTGDPLALGCLAITAVVVAPLFEETLFRGVLLPVLSRHWGAAAGVGLSALIFGLAHLSLGELTPLTLLGLALGWLRLRHGRLGPCVLMHGLWNGLTFLNLILLT
jgi:membrane protease YdiL (CAAX protease family)